jgi:hypothetical protein
MAGIAAVTIVIISPKLSECSLPGEGEGGRPVMMGSGTEPFTLVGNLEVHERLFEFPHSVRNDHSRHHWRWRAVYMNRRVSAIPPTPAPRNQRIPR